METSRTDQAGRYFGPLALGVFVRAALSLGLLGHMPMVSDAQSYAEEARGLLSQWPPLQPLYWPPGNSLVLWAGYRVLGPSSLSARLTLLLIEGLSLLLVVACARRLCQSSRAAVGAAGYLAALYPPAVMLAGQSYSQHLSALCLLGVALAGPSALRRGRVGAAVVLGGCFGLGALTRPGSFSLVLVLAPLCLWPRRPGADAASASRRLLAGVVSAAVAVALLAPAIRHNQRLGAGLVVSTNNERNFFLGNNPYTPDYKTSHLGQRALSQLPAETRLYLEGFYRQPDARAAMKQAALRYIAEHPLRTLYRTWNRTLSFWGFDYLSSRLIQAHLGAGQGALLPLLAVEAGGYLIAMGLALCGLWAALLRGPLQPGLRRSYALWLLGLIVAYQVPYCVAFSGGTYHYPAVWLLWPFAGVTAARLVTPGGRSEVRELLRRPPVWGSLLLLLLLQVQYAAYAIAMDS